MGLAVISADGTPDIRTMLDELQFEQFEHDETYHREIARLPTQARLRHMALHFAKYSGNLTQAQAEGDEVEVQRIATDVFIIGMSTANVLNCRLGAELSHTPVDRGQAELPFASSLAIEAGKMAAACEKLDHLEDFPFRPVIRGAAVELVRAAIVFAEGQGWNLSQLIRLRLKAVKEKFIHHSRV